jgi:hypothetical protein
MRRVAKAVGITPMAIYRHYKFAGRAEEKIRVVVEGRPEERAGCSFGVDSRAAEGRPAWIGEAST